MPSGSSLISAVDRCLSATFTPPVFAGDDSIDADATAARDDPTSACVPRDLLSETLQFRIPNIASVKTLQENIHQAQLKFAKGTTTLAFVYRDGIVVSVDSRASMGPYMSSGTVKKIIEINEFMVGTMAGGAADCSYWERVLALECRAFELRNKERITVTAASKLFQNIIYYYRGQLSMGIMLAGFDKAGVHLYYIDSEGTRVKGQRFSVGSGSTYAYGVLDAGYRYDLSKEEAIDLGRRAVLYATHRDAMSGGMVRVYHIGKSGWERVSLTDTKELYYQYLDEKKAKATADAPATDAAMAE